MPRFEIDGHGAPALKLGQVELGDHAQRVGGEFQRADVNAGVARLVPVYSAPIEAEYRAVLTRAKFNIGAEVLADFFSRLPVMGQFENNIPQLEIALPDPTDAPFIALARYAACPVITGNVKHFPAAAGVVLTPAGSLKAASANPFEIAVPGDGLQGVGRD